METLGIIVKPDTVTSSESFLSSQGRQRWETPKRLTATWQRLHWRQTVVSELKMVPNQPLVLGRNGGADGKTH